MRALYRAALLLSSFLPISAFAQGGPAPLSGASFESVIRGVVGMLVIIAIAWVFSAKRKNVDWKVVGIGLAFQLVLALLILYVPPIQVAFEVVGQLFVKVLDFTRIGSEFLFRDLMNVQSMGFIFALQILPTIIFFSALTSVLFYLGIIQKVVYALAWALNKTMKLSGAESLSTAGNIFLGQTEARSW